MITVIKYFVWGFFWRIPKCFKLHFDVFAVAGKIKTRHNMDAVFVRVWRPPATISANNRHKDGSRAIEAGDRAWLTTAQQMSLSSLVTKRRRQLIL